MATTPVSESTDGPVLSVINKRLRTLRKKLTRILQMEESLSQGKTLNKEQEETLRSKTHVTAAIDELEKLRVPLATAVTEEIALAVARHQQESSSSAATPAKEQDDGAVVEDLLNLLYFGSMFDVKGQNDFTSTMLTRTHERGCCLTYDYVTDDESSGDLLSEKDLDLIAMLSGLMVSRPVDSSLSHKEALQRCVLNAKQWLLRSDHPIDSDPNVTYSGLKVKLNKIMASDYFTTTPEMKATVEMAAAAAGNYASFQVPVHEPMGPVSVPVHVEGLDEQYQLQKDEEASNFQGNETYDNQSSPVEESQKGEFGSENSAEVWSQTEVEEPQGESQNQKDMESKEQQYAPRRNFQNNPRGGRGAGGAAGVITPMAVDREEAAGEVGPTRMAATNFMTTLATTLVTFTLGAITAIGEEAAGVLVVVVETFTTIMVQELKPPIYQLSHDLTTQLVVYRAFLGN